MANLLATAKDPGLRRPAEALKIASAVVAAIKRSHPAPLYTLAAALDANGQRGEAENTRAQARALCARSPKLAAVCKAPGP